MILRQCDRKNADVMDFSERKRLYGGLLFLDRGQIGCSLKRRTPYSWIMDRNEMIGKRTNVLGTLSWPASFITGLLKYSSKTMKKIRFGAVNKVRQLFYLVRDINSPIHQSTFFFIEIFIHLLFYRNWNHPSFLKFLGGIKMHFTAIYSYLDSQWTPDESKTIMIHEI